MKLIKILNEGGELLSSEKEVRRIKKEEIKPTLQIISGMSGLPVKYLQANLIGSAGKRPESGDIDIAIDIKELPKYGYDTYLDLHDKMTKQTTGKFHKKFKVGVYKVPIKGDEKNGFVQVDFMYVNNPEWAKFAFYAPDSSKSKYKGAVRTALLMGVIEAIDTGYSKYDDNDTLVGKATNKLDLPYGVRPSFKQHINNRLRPVNGVQFQNNFPDSKVKLDIIDDPEKIAKQMFGNKVKLEQLETAESILELIDQKFDNSVKEKIFNNAKQRLRTLYGKIRIPPQLERE